MSNMVLKYFIAKLTELVLDLIRGVKVQIS